LSCQRIEALGCDVEPVSANDLCSQPRRCLVGFKLPDSNSVLTKIDKCNPLELETPAPERSGILSTAVLGVDGTMGDASGVPDPGAIDGIRDQALSSGSWFLVAKREDGYCLVDSLLPPDGGLGFFTYDFTMAWTHAASSPVLQIHAHSAYHLELDEQEVEDMIRAKTPEGQDGFDVAAESCRHYTYKVSEGRFTRVRAREAEGACRQNRNALRLRL